MTISVLMAVYNRENTVSDAIESIAVQLTDDDEMIISDDGSTDSTLEICRNKQKKYPFIKIIKHEHSNIDDHMFYLIKKATKDICIIADSDDVSLINRVEEITKIYKDNLNIKCVYHNAYVINENRDVTNNDFFVLFKQKNIFINLFLKSTFFGACMSFNTYYAKRIIDFVEDNKIKLSRDKSIGFVMKSRKLIMFSEKKLLMYRRWDNNISKKSRPILDKIKEKIICFYLYFESKKINF